MAWASVRALPISTPDRCLGLHVKRPNLAQVLSTRHAVGEYTYEPLANHPAIGASQSGSRQEDILRATPDQMLAPDTQLPEGNP